MIRIAFVKYAGLASGGTERWLQAVAAHLPRDEFAVDYWYCDSAPHIGSDSQARGTDPVRKRWMEDRGVSLIEFHVEAVDLTKRTKPWVGTDFWDLFDPNRYDLVQTAKEGPAEYPFHLLDLPVFEYITYNGGVDHSPNTVVSIHLSQWQRAWWMRRGGDVAKTMVVPIPAPAPSSDADLRAELGIPAEAVVAGFHQRPDDRTFSTFQLEAFSRIARPGRHFVVLGGSGKYAAQAAELGTPNVHFLPANADDAAVSRFLNTLDVLAHGRRDGETYGTVFADAMMHGVPCLSHRVPAGGNAQRETIGPAGFVVDDVAGYAEVLERLMSDPDLRRRLGAKGRVHASERYTLESVVDRMAARYRAFAGGAPARGPGQPVAYGEAPGGLLIAGDLDSPGHPAASVLTGRVPRGREVGVLRAVLDDVRAVVEVGADRPVLALYAAQWAGPGVAVTIVEHRPGTCAAARASVALNNWEDRVRLVHAPGCPAGPDSGTLAEVLAGAGGPAVLSVTSGAAGWLDVLAPQVAHVAVEGPVPRKQLERSGYRLVTGSGWAARGRPAVALQQAVARAALADVVERQKALATRVAVPVRTRLPAPVRRALRRAVSTLRR